MQAEQPTITPTTARVLRVFLENPSAERYGFELMQAAKISSGSLYPILARLQRAGWLEGGKEDIDPQKEGRPARKYYKLTGDGVPAARRALVELSELFMPPQVSTPGLPAFGGGPA